MNVTQCDPSDPNGCSQTTETVTPRSKPKSQPGVTVITVPDSQPAQEVHQLSLKTGKDQVQTTSGAKATDTE